MLKPLVNKFQNLSIKSKFLSIQLVSVILVLVFFFGTFVLGQYRQFEQSSYQRMTILAEVLGSNSASALLFFDNAVAEDVLASLSTQQDILNAVIFDHNGDEFARYDKNDVFTFPPVKQNASRYKLDKNLILHKSIVFDKGAIGQIVLRLDPSTQRDQIFRVLAISVIIFSAGLFLVFMLSMKIQYPITNSILSLSRLTERVRESGNYSHRVKVTSQDEIGTLVTGFNSMMEKISDTEKHLERKVSERTVELEKAKLKAEESDHLKSAFLASMSHELRTPLNSIIGFSGILLQERVGPLNEEQRKQLNIVKGSSSHLLDLINDVLDISKIESGRLQVSGEKFKIDLLIIMTISTLRPFAEKKGLTLDYEIEPDLPHLFSDKRRVEQVLINLINNAIKFTTEGSIRVLCSKKDGRLVVRVVDTGIGIKEDDYETIFSNFRQIEGGLNQAVEGSGLGLSISQKLAELLGGTIDIESEFGVGSTFTVTLPFSNNEIPDEN